jgi:aryl-alcohol dehydrogenase-like predicted oxidoreductase
MSTTTTIQTAPLGPRTVRRIGFGAMQLAGPNAFGPPADPAAARAVLRRAVERGVDHIDTAQVYGPDVVDELIAEALHPYPGDLVIATKVGGARDAQGAWIPASRPEELRATLEADLRLLRRERIDLVYLRRGVGGPAALAADPAIAAVAQRHGATPAQVALAWLLAHDGMLIIPGTSSIAHLEENLAAGAVRLDAQDLAALER